MANGVEEWGGTGKGDAKRCGNHQDACNQQRALFS